MDDTITKAELARQLNLSRPRVTQLCQAGLPVRPDGKLNRMEAVEWVRTHVDRPRGGWSEGMRPRKNGKARDASTRKELELDIPQDDWTCDYRSLSDYWRGAVDIVNALRRPQNIRCIADMGIAHGCTAAQAYGVAQMYGFLLALWMHDAVAARLGQEHARVIHLFETQPDWSGIAHIAGEPLDVPAWENESQWRLEKWKARVETELSKSSRPPNKYEMQ